MYRRVECEDRRFNRCVEAREQRDFDEQYTDDCEEDSPV